MRAAGWPSPWAHGTTRQPVLTLRGNDAGPIGTTDGKQILRFAHSDAVQTAKFNPDGSCVITTSGYRMASGGAPQDGNVSRLWDAATGARLIEWQSGTFGPDAAFFVDGEHVVVLYQGAGLVYRTQLCAPIDALVGLAKARVSRELTAEERARYVPSTSTAH